MSSIGAITRHRLFWPVVALAVLVLACVLKSNTFLNITVLDGHLYGGPIDIVRRSSVLLLVALGMTLVIATRGIDLSVGAVMALTGTLAAGLMAGGMHPGGAFAVALLVGIGFGALNGVLIAYAGMPSIIVTLATMGIARGLALLERSATGSEVTIYHLEAAIAAAHAAAPAVEETDWALIVSLYDRLITLAPSPVVALNRAVAVAERDGPAQGIDELLAIADRSRLERYPFYPAAIGELELRRGNLDAARFQFSNALTLARNAAERRYLEKILEKCRGL